MDVGYVLVSVTRIGRPRGRCDHAASVPAIAKGRRTPGGRWEGFVRKWIVATMAAATLVLTGAPPASAGLIEGAHAAPVQLRKDMSEPVPPVTQTFTFEIRPPSPTNPAPDEAPSAPKQPSRPKPAVAVPAAPSFTG